MRKLSVVLSALAIISSATVAMADITVGVVLSTTGPAASLGIPEKNSLEFAPKTISGQNVKYIVYDDATDTTTAVQNVKRLISESNVDLIIGPSTTPTTMTVVNVASEANTPMISLASASPIVKPIEKRKWIFKVPADDEITASVMANHMAKKGVKSVAIIATDDPYGEANTVAFKHFADKKGIKTTTVEKYKKNDTSAMAQVLKSISGKPDAVYIVAAGTPSAMPHVTLIERGYKGKIYQSHGAANSDFLRVGGKALEGAYIPASPILAAEQLPKDFPNKKEALNFTKTYEAKFGPVSTFASHTWDALHIMEGAVPKALKVAKPGTPEFRAALRDGIEATKGYKGAYAVYNMSATNHSGVSEAGIVMLKIVNGKWKIDEVSHYK